MAFIRPSVVVALIMASAAPAHAFKTFSVGSSSMVPTLFEDDTVTVAEYGVDYEAMAKGALPDQARSADPRFAPKAGDLAAFRTEQYVYVKRIVAMAGQRVQMRGGVLNIDGVALATQPVDPVDEDACRPDQTCTFLREALPDGTTYVVMDSVSSSPVDDTREFLVPDGHVFVVGDNRDNSVDSREGSEFAVIGFVPQSALIGRVTGVSPNWNHAPGAERLAGYPSR